MKKGIVFSCFDLLHAGHVTMLEEAKERCDYLIAGLHTNPEHKNRVVQSCFERYTQLKGCKYVDEIIPYDSEDDLVNMLKTITPLHIRFLGNEYWVDKKIITGYNICQDRDIDIHYCRRDHDYSSTELKERIVSLSNTLTD
jgi:glycerol-3-phosphate cytidylyltransferase